MITKVFWRGRGEPRILKTWDPRIREPSNPVETNGKTLHMFLHCKAIVEKMTTSGKSFPGPEIKKIGNETFTMHSQTKLILTKKQYLGSGGALNELG